MASLNPGAVILPTTYFNTGTNNPASLNYTDRTVDSNVYLLFMSMVAIGGLENRYGAPNSQGVGQTALPWSSMASSSSGLTTQQLQDGCAFAASLANFADAISTTASDLSGPIASAVGSLNKAFTSGINGACEAGCNGPTACNGSVTCTECPLSLRNRANCTGENTDVNSCAAEGLSQFVNFTWEGITP